MILLNLLTSCKTKVVAVNNYCVIAKPIRASAADKVELKKSQISKEFVEKIVNHNYIFNQTCPDK